ncbi:SpoIIE family protein phosphatase [Streptomyces sp. NBC_00670]|uniref:SpoIIE family protein phosphatase n=1 Tax=Streptomyces sp. NBC_00670 TaxID=2975804 RepID=UPI002E31485C|nr:SpoIIE family protein phosphatase [Streptomyces sp. NBC_00670]
MTSESALPEESSAEPDVVALAKVVAVQRAELDRLRSATTLAAVLERAKGAVMALTGRSADAAHEELLRRAEAAGRTLVEECWITLGGTAGCGPEQQEPAPCPGTEPAVHVPAEYGASAIEAAATSETGPAGDVDSAGAAVLAGIAEALVGVSGPEELAHRLREHLAGAVMADGVLIYAGLPAGGLRLAAHAGVTETVAAQWRHVPPLSGIAALEAIRTRRPYWLDDPGRDEKSWSLIGAPERWPTRAWLPVLTEGGTTASLGILRATPSAFTPAAKALLRATALLCADRLRGFLAAPDLVAADPLRDTVQTVFDALPGPAVLLVPLRSAAGEVEDFRIAAAAPRAVDVAGRRGRQLVGLRVLECYPTVVGEPLWEGYHRALATGEPYEGEPFVYQEVAAGVPESSTYSVRAVRSGDALVVTWIRHDSSDREEQRLAELQRLGNLGWADWDLVGGRATWSPQVFTILAREPARGTLSLTDLPEHVAPDDAPVLRHAVGELLAKGRPLDIPFRVHTVRGVRHLRLVAEPVTDADGSPLEVHGFLQDHTAQRSAELALVESERAMLTQHGALLAERTLADRLQHTLLPLPRRPLSLAGLRVDVAYRPAQSGIHVGGDWFSAIELPDGSALFVVGDVAGHGIDAVATMAQLRFTAKGMIITGSTLTGALIRLNALLLHTRDAKTTATLVLARYEPGRRRLVWAQAGHPPPLLLRQGAAGYLDRPAGVLLGARHDPSFAEAEFRLEPGDHLLFYTDGLVERPAEGLDVGFDRLARAAAALHPEGPGPLRPLLDAMLEGELRDDVCVLDVHLPPDAG